MYLVIGIWVYVYYVRTNGIWDIAIIKGFMWPLLGLIGTIRRIVWILQGRY